jgi:hypothetical protein
MESASQPKGIIMHNRFRKACYRLAGGVAVTAALGLAAAGAASASPGQIRTTGGPGTATPSATKVCGTSCNDLFNLALGHKFIPRTNGHYGSDLDLALAHNFTPSEDFIAKQVGTLGQFLANGLISPRSYVALNYPSTWPVFEEEFAPYSVTTGLCAGVSQRDLRQHGEISLRYCGANARTLWVGDLANSIKDTDSILGFDLPWVNGADMSFSHALSLTTDDFGHLYLARLALNGGAVNDNQEWGVKLGPAT